METQTKQEVMIGLWQTKRADFSVSHKNGLTKEQVELLQGFKVGDRLKLWVCQKSDIITRPTFRLGKLAPLDSGK